jgi:Uma2 family endonuclease
MASLPNARTVTYEEWLTMPEVQDAIQEVVNGEIRIMPPPKSDHGVIIDNLSFQLRSQVNPKDVQVRAADFGLVVRERPLTSWVPDLAAFQRATAVEKDGYIHSASQLAVEVLSPSNTRIEREEKLGDYTTIGVAEVWVISPEARTIEILSLDNGLLRQSQILSQGVLQPKLFPHVHIDIAQIWPD